MRGPPEISYTNLRSAHFIGTLFDANDAAGA